MPRFRLAMLSAALGSMLTIIGSLAAAEKVPEMIAHRGASWDAPENTLASIELAWKQGADGAEFDVVLSRDGKIVLSHDHDLKRIAKFDKKVVDLDLAELEKIDVGSWKDSQFRNERMPTLAQVLAMVPEGRQVFIEVKCGPEIVPELKRVLTESKLQSNQTCIISFSKEVVAAAKEALPDRPGYWIHGLTSRDSPKAIPTEKLIQIAKEIKADGLDLSAQPDIVTEEMVKQIRDAGLKLYVWTVNDISVALKMKEIGVDGITTDRPEWLRDRIEYPNAVRVMSFNVRYGTASDGDNHWEKRKNHLVETIRNYDPDLLGTQENLPFQRDFIQSNLGKFDVVSAGREDGKEKGETTAIYYKSSRFELIESGHFWLSDTPNVVGSKSWDSSLPRICSWVLLKDKKRINPSAPPLLFMNTHFDHKGSVARKESAKLIRAEIEKRGKECDLIVTGDFNAAANSEPYQVLFDDSVPSHFVLQDTYLVTHGRNVTKSGTFNGFNAQSNDGPRIDWIGVSKSWKVLKAKMDFSTKQGRVPSDHFPVTADINPN